MVLMLRLPSVGLLLCPLGRSPDAPTPPSVSRRRPLGAYTHRKPAPRSRSLPACGPPDCALRSSTPLLRPALSLHHHALLTSLEYDQCFVDTVPLGVVAHGAPSGHRVNPLSGFRTRCWCSYLPRARCPSFACHSLTLFSYQIGPITSW